jgi:DNA topoisomerase-3
MEMIANEDMPGPLRAWPHAKKAIKEGYVKPNKRIFDNAKVSDHFAIIPTLHRAQEPDRDRGQALRHGGQALPRGVLSAGRVHGHDAHLDGDVQARPQLPDQRQGDGQAGLARGVRPRAQEDDANLVAVKQGEKVRTESVDVNALKTKPPARYTEATLLSAMEGAGKLIDDDDMREAMQEKGLGTPATRAAIIEGLIMEKYIYRDGRELVPTAKAFQLTTLLRGLGVEDLTKPELTGNWEYQLSEMEKGKLSRETFMARSRR